MNHTKKLTFYDYCLSQKTELVGILNDTEYQNLKAVSRAPHKDPKHLDPLIQKSFPFTYQNCPFSWTNESKKTGKNITQAVKVGVILSGGPASGGHNVICGLFDSLKKLHPESQLIGFLGGPSGLLNNEFILLDDTKVHAHLNTGGFDIIGSGRTKLETIEHFEKTLKTIHQHQLDALVIIGGDDSNTNTACLAEYFKSKNDPTIVVGVPKTIDGDLKNQDIEISFGFDTACKIYSETISNIARDAISSRKYWHFIKVMGRTASHIALECALKTHPNICFISEEVEKEKYSLRDIINQISNVIFQRAIEGNSFGIILIPEGLIEFIHDIQMLIHDLNNSLAEKKESLHTLIDEDKLLLIQQYLPKDSLYVFNSLPKEIALQLLLDRDPHGNVQVSLIETEKLLISLVTQRVKELEQENKKKISFAALHHFLGYEGRAGYPSWFDRHYCYSLGYNAALLIAHGYSGYMSTIKNLTHQPKNWQAGGTPVVQMLNPEVRHGKIKPVIKKALVDLNGRPFVYFKENRDFWSLNTDYQFVGPRQFDGPLAHEISLTLELEQLPK